MTIRMKCPNGHSLVAKESNAGKTGKCPVCKAPVSIPPLNQTVVSDSTIMNILGDPNMPSKSRVGTTISPHKKAAPVKQRERVSESSSASSITMPHVKVCPSCEREIDLGYHICPFCHTYITGLNDF